MSFPCCESFLVTVAGLLLIVLPLSASSGRAQEVPAGFEDVPPWHWAFAAVSRLAEEGIVVGYPRNDPESARNAVQQVYEAFAHSSHAAARQWAEAFLTNLPSDWPQPLQRSRVTGYVITDETVRVTGARGMISYLSVLSLRGAPAVTGRVTVAVLRDETGRLRVDYATLAAAQPQVFR